jgi:hypothetical protein
MREGLEPTPFHVIATLAAARDRLKSVVTRGNLIGQGTAWANRDARTGT